MEIPRIRVVCLDIYGTILATDDHDNSFPPRKGLKSLFDRCDSMNIRVVSTSDAYVPNVQADICDCFQKHDELQLNIKRFFDFYQLDELPVKDFSKVAKSFGISNHEILVIGDHNKDINGAKKHECFAIRCPEYTIEGEREFDLLKAFNEFLIYLYK